MSYNFVAGQRRRVWVSDSGRLSIYDDGEIEIFNNERDSVSEVISFSEAEELFEALRTLFD